PSRDLAVSPVSCHPDCQGRNTSPWQPLPGSLAARHPRPDPARFVAPIRLDLPPDPEAIRADVLGSPLSLAEAYPADGGTSSFRTGGGLVALGDHCQLESRRPVARLLALAVPANGIGPRLLANHRGR